MLLAKIHTNPEDNIFDLVTNQYLLLWNKNTGDIIKDCKFKWNGAKLVTLKYKRLETKAFGTVKPLNVKQECLFDLLQSNVPVKVVWGKFGTGKDFLMINHWIHMMEQRKLHKVVFLRNNFQVVNTKEVGYLKGTLEEKLSWLIGPLIDHLGGTLPVETMVKENRLELVHTGFLRGRDIRDSLIYGTEMQNTDVGFMQLLLGRVGEGSQLWLNGDFKQIDSKLFEQSNGLKALTKLAGNELYGQVTLDKCERSSVANLADLLDD